MTKPPYYIGVDLGGTSIMTAAVRDGEVLADDKRKTRADQGVDVVIERVAESVRAVLEESEDQGKPQGLCIGAPGTVDHGRGIVFNAPNLGWQDVPLGPRLEAALGLPVTVDNDVNVGATGEHVHGAAKGALHVAAIFVGTGIGGALIVDGQMHTGFRGAAGEFGHMIVQPNGRKCPCGRRGCVEAYASKTAMEAMVREEMAKGRKSKVLEIMKDKGKDKLSSSVVEKALESEDALMAEVVQTAQLNLGLLAANVVNAFDPEVIVFGGGIVERFGEDFVEPVATTARKYFREREGAERIRIVPAALGDHAGTVGAAVIASRRGLAMN